MEKDKRLMEANHTNIYNVGEGEGGKIWENGIET